MPRGTKIATCTYCGTRAALQFDRGRHELVCTACGAPLHDLKMLRADAVDPEMHRPPAPGAKGRRRRNDRGLTPPPHRDRRAEPPRPSPAKKTRKRKRKSLWRKALSEAFDVIEDIFD